MHLLSTDMTADFYPQLAQPEGSSQAAGMFTVSETPALSSPSSGAAQFSIEPPESRDAELPGVRGDR